MFDPSQTPLVAETLLKKRRSLEEAALIRAENLKKEVKRRRVVRGENVKIRRPEEFMKRKITKENSKKKFDRKSSSVNTKKVAREVKPSVGFAVRILGGKNASDEVKEALNGLGLSTKYDGAFIKLDKEGLAKLKPLEDYLAYGYISMKMVEELVHRRAFIIEEGSKKPLSDNMIVENALGHLNIICLSDLSHEIYHVGEHFTEALQILAPFSLSAPTGGFEKKTLHIAADERRFLGDKMEAFLNKIL